jgi:hypothetical protein
MTSETHIGQPSPAQAKRRQHIEQLLDEALEATFPASDPVALTLGQYPTVKIPSATCAEREQP